MHGRLQHLVHRSVLRAGNRHHEDPQRRDARLRSVPECRGRGGAGTGAHRFLQLRRGLPAQARHRDVRVHQGTISAHLSVHQHERPDVHRGIGAPARPLGHRRSHVLDRRRVAGDLRPVPPARKVRSRHPQSADHGGGKAEIETGRSAPELALHPLQVERQRRER